MWSIREKSMNSFLINSLPVVMRRLWMFWETMFRTTLFIIPFRNPIPCMSISKFSRAPTENSEKKYLICNISFSLDKNNNIWALRFGKLGLLDWPSPTIKCQCLVVTVYIFLQNLFLNHSKILFNHALITCLKVMTDEYGQL